MTSKTSSPRLHYLRTSISETTTTLAVTARTARNVSYPPSSAILHYGSFSPGLQSPVRCYMIFFRDCIVSVTMQLVLLLPVNKFTYVLWHLMQKYHFTATQLAVSIYFASGLSQQYGIIMEKHFRISPLLTEYSVLLSAAVPTGSKKDEIALLSFAVRYFRAPFQDVCGKEKSPEAPHLTA